MRLVILCAMFILSATILNAKKKSQDQVPPDGYIRTVEEGIRMITVPVQEAISKIGPGVSTTIVGDGFLCATPELIIELYKTIRASDQIGIEELIAENKVSRVEPGTPVLIIDILGDQEIREAARKQANTYVDLHYTMQNICRLASTQKSPTCRFAAKPTTFDPFPYLRSKVRVLQGQLAGTAWWVTPFALAAAAEAPSVRK
jgi:hypothetical protein